MRKWGKMEILEAAYKNDSVSTTHGNPRTLERLRKEGLLKYSEATPPNKVHKVYWLTERGVAAYKWRKR